MAVTAIPRFDLGLMCTPLMRAERLERALGSPPLYVKRDDLVGFALAGNKARLLEGIVGDALARDCTVLVTGGGPSSSYLQGAAVAAAIAGLRCVLVMYGTHTGSHPNLALARSAGAEVRFTGDAARESVDAALDDVAAELRARGERPCVVPRGGATAAGAAGYARAVVELCAQLGEAGVAPETLLVATGSGTTQAGLLAGAVATHAPWRTVGASVSRPPDAAAAQVLSLASECAVLLGCDAPAAGDVDVRDAREPGYGMASTEGTRVAELALRTEGLVLDPVFTAKALALLPALVAAGLQGPVVFVHTGGIPVALAHAMRGGPQT